MRSHRGKRSAFRSGAANPPLYEGEDEAQEDYSYYYPEAGPSTPSAGGQPWYQGEATIDPAALTRTVSQEYTYPEMSYNMEGQFSRT